MNPLDLEKKQEPTKRRKSLLHDSDIKQELFRPEYRFDLLDPKREKMWALMDIYLPRDITSIQKSIVTHIEYTLSTPRFDINDGYIFQGTALSVRDRLLEEWNDTQLYIKLQNPKKIYYLSIEFLLGRLLQNALVNLNVEDNYRKALEEFGYKLEELYEKENDPALGNGGLGRLAACYIDSMATLNLPAWGYGIRYDYGIFKQVIENFQQKELPDYWLTKGNPWEIVRLDTSFKIRFYGYIKNDGTSTSWAGGEEVLAVAHDTAVPGFKTFNCNTLRLWKSYPSEEFDFASFNKGDYQTALLNKNDASFITSVLYPNDNTLLGKELRLKQEYFFSSATVQNVIRRFKRRNLPWSDFPKYNCMQLNDTHPTLAAIELLRVLIDENGIDFKNAFEIVKKSFNYTNHTVLPEALEKWGVDILERLLPRHLDLIYKLNHFFMTEVSERFPGDFEKASILSIVEESQPKLIRMANLCIICSSKVNGVAKIHSELLKTTLFKHFYEMYPYKFTNVTNGVTPRRWVHCAFPELSHLLTEYHGNDDWLSEYDLLAELPEKLEKEGKYAEFAEKYKAAKLTAKKRMKDFIYKVTRIEIDETFLYDIMVKRIHEYKRQFMNLLYCIHRYLKIKKMSSVEKQKLVKRVTFFGGKAAPGYAVAKNVIRLINMVSAKINSDPDVSPYYKLIFIPDYKVSSAQIIIPSADISQHISTAGTEASGTSCMKFTMTGSMIIGTHDGANIEIAKEIGDDNMFFFGNKVDDVKRIRQEMQERRRAPIPDALIEAFEAILTDRFGDTSFMHEYVRNMMHNVDFYLYTYDFAAYVEAQDKVDRDYADYDNWVKRCIHSITHMGYFSSDRSIMEYAENIWNVKPLDVPDPKLTKDQHTVERFEDIKELEKTA